MGSDHLTIVFNVPVYSSDAGEKIIFPWSLKVKNMMLKAVAKPTLFYCKTVMPILSAL